MKIPVFIAQRMIPFIISLSFFMEAVDSTVINTAIPAMSRSLMVSPIDLKIALISYLLSLAIFIPISGWIADKYGTKNVYIIASVIFTLSSLWCGFAHNVLALVIARFIQGFGGALTLPVGRLILLRTFGRKNLLTTMNRVITVAALGIMLGPLIGGFITVHFSWHWIFWVNIPVGLCTIVLAYYFMGSNEPKPVPPLDIIGFILFGIALSGIIFGFSALSEISMNLNIGLSILVLATMILLVYIKHSNHQEHPVVNTDLLNHTTFCVSVSGNLLSRIGFGGVPFILPLLFQIGMGCSAELSGLLLAPTALGVLLAKRVAIPLLRFFGYKYLLILNTLCAGLSIGVFSSIGPSTSYILIGFLTFVFGYFSSLQYSSLNSLAYAEISADQLSVATSMMSTIQQLAQSFGVATCALFIRGFSSDLSNVFIVSTGVFRDTFFALGFITMMSTILYIRLKQDDGLLMIPS